MMSASATRDARATPPRSRPDVIVIGGGDPDGARRLLPQPLPCAVCRGRPCEKACDRATFAGAPVPIVANLEWLAAGRPSA